MVSWGLGEVGLRGGGGELEWVGLGGCGSEKKKDGRHIHA